MVISASLDLVVPQADVDAGNRPGKAVRF